MNKENVLYTYNRILFGLKKEEIPAVCDNIDEPREYNTKWNKSQVTEEQILHDSIHMRYLK